MSLRDRMVHSWNAFMNKDPTRYSSAPTTSTRPDRQYYYRRNDQSIVTAVCNRIAIDCASISVLHCNLDESKRFKSEVDSELNKCLTLSANVDQTGRALRQDAFYSILEEGVIAIVPTDIEVNDDTFEIDDISTIRVAKILQWRPQEVQVRCYNEQTGLFEDIWVAKKRTMIVENPLYEVMNRPNSTMQRLKRKLDISDIIDEQNSANRLDLIIQLPYAIKSPARQQQAEERKKNIEVQLSQSNMGIAYIDSTEHVTQLNRSVENQMMEQIDYLTTLFYAQLGLTVEIMNGTANEEAMSNYYSRTIEPILSAFVDEMKRKFLSESQLSEKQSIEFFRDPFKLVPVNEIAEIADKFTRNEILTSNEVRQIVGMKPADDPRADELRNKNLSEAKGEAHLNVDGENITGDESHQEHE